MPISAAQYSLEIAYEGQVLSLNHNTNIKGTYEEVTNASTTDYLPYGRFIVEKAGGLPGEIELPTSTGLVLLGVTVFSDTDEKLADGTSGYPPQTAAAYMTEGIIGVVAETAMTRGGPIFARHTANGALDQLGRIRNDADTANADAVLATEAKVLADCAAGEVCKLEVYISPIKS